MKDLNSFLNEEDKKKDTSKPHAVKDEQEGVDDKKYFALMGEYKQLRRNPKNRAEAKKILDKAMKLAKEGDVTPDCKLAAAYL